MAATLAGDRSGPTGIVKACFEWVRDEIRHSGDAGLAGSSCAASEALAAGDGWCFAKSHLLAALLRANGIPAGLCYQRLKLGDGYEDRDRFTLHGLNAVFLPNIGWLRLDPRGNKPGVDAQFDPPGERLAFALEAEGETDFQSIYADPLAEVADWLRSNRSYEQAAASLPDGQTLPVGAASWR